MEVKKEVKVINFFENNLKGYSIEHSLNVPNEVVEEGYVIVMRDSFNMKNVCFIGCVNIRLITHVLGNKIYFNKELTNFVNEDGTAFMINMMNNESLENNKIEVVFDVLDGYMYFKTDIPHNTFKVFSSNCNSIHCLGIVFNIKDLK